VFADAIFIALIIILPLCAFLGAEQSKRKVLEEDKKRLEKELTDVKGRHERATIHVHSFSKEAKRLKEILDNELHMAEVYRLDIEELSEDIHIRNAIITKLQEERGFITRLVTSSEEIDFKTYEAVRTLTPYEARKLDDDQLRMYEGFIRAQLAHDLVKSMVTFSSSTIDGRYQIKARVYAAKPKGEDIGNCKVG